MIENIIKSGNVTIVVNGGDPLGDCPTDGKQEPDLELKLNGGRNKNDDELPYWDFDCGFKLDFDGSLVQVSSRFYPPKSHSGNSWTGTLTISLYGKEVSEKKFDCKTLDELHAEVTAYVQKIVERIKTIDFKQ